MLKKNPWWMKEMATEKLVSMLEDWLNHILPSQAPHIQMYTDVYRCTSSLQVGAPVR
jgi:hypothetical protein